MKVSGMDKKIENGTITKVQQINYDSIIQSCEEWRKDNVFSSEEIVKNE